MDQPSINQYRAYQNLQNHGKLYFLILAIRRDMPKKIFSLFFVYQNKLRRITILILILSIYCIYQIQQMVQIHLLQKFKKNESIFKEIESKIQNQKYQLLIGEYKLVGYINQGSFGVVYKAVHMQSKRPAAVKLVNIEKLMKKNPSEEVRQKLKNYLHTQEILMRKCHSAFVVKLFETYENTKCKILIMEYCRNGSLQDYIKQRGAVQQQDAIQILRQIILGLAVSSYLIKELHRNNIIHRDLKPANILIHNGIFKIADFGFCKQIEDTDAQIPRTFCGTRMMMAPQIRNTGIYGLKADIWSLGVIFFMMLYPKAPFNQRYLKIKSFLQNGERFLFRTVSGAVIGQNSSKFLEETLQEDSKKRISWQETLQHQIFQVKFHKLPNVYVPRIKQVFEQLKDEKVNVPEHQALNLKKSLIQFERLKQQTAKVLTHSPKVNEQQLNWQIDIDILNNQYLQCRISEFIFYEIILPIQEKYLLNMETRFHVQFLFLLINRCRENIICAKDIVQSKYPQSIADHFCQQVRELEEIISKKFAQIADKLCSLENKVLSIISDKISNIFNRSFYQERQRFLTYFQRQSFNKQDQIKFTCEKYLVKIVNQLKGNKADEERMRKMIKSYRQINQIRLQQLQGKKISKRIEQILEDYD